MKTKVNVLKQISRYGYQSKELNPINCTRITKEGHKRYCYYRYKLDIGYETMLLSSLPCYMYSMTKLVNKHFKITTLFQSLV